jgi:asparagine synthase (glutamine-hydrolysing)
MECSPQATDPKMCGITGVINYAKAAPIDVAELERMNGALVHRGPDDSGTFIHDNVAIAMRRLSIVDVAGGHQPVSNEDGAVQVVFNGEIYNHDLLRRELRARGHVFKTASDTEVIAHLYEEYGDDFIERLDGMFAIAIADCRTRGSVRLVLVRDAWGKKPLYYSDDGSTLRFASELKSLARRGDAVDAQALWHYLSLLVIPAPWTIFASVKKLEPGCRMVIDAHGVRISTFADPRAWIGSAPLTRDAVMETRRLLLLAVEKRLATEVPFGAFLSGGIDSGVVVAVMSALLGERVATYSIGFDGPATHDESALARRTAEHLRTDHHEIRADPNVLELLPDLVAATDEPFAVSSSLPMLLLSRAASRDVKVVLTGDGGDEVFAGYAQYRYERWAAAWRRLPHGTDRFASLDRRGGKFVAAARAESAGERRLRWASGFLDDEKSDVLAQSEALAPTSALLDGTAASAASRIESHTNAIDLRVFLADEMLCKVDRMTMAASVEARSPLLDDALARHVLSIDIRSRVGMTQLPKRLLVEAVREWLPPHLLSRRKWGFNMPLDTWIRGGAREFVTKRLSQDRLRAGGLLAPHGVRRLLDDHFAGRRNAANRIFSLLVLQTWAERWLA